MTHASTGRPVASERRGRPPELTITCADLTPHTVRADAGPITLGRELPAQIRVADQRVSRSHLLVEPAGATWTVTDTHSTNGTFLDGEPIGPRLDITDGLTLHIGHPKGIPVTFTFTFADVEDDDHAPSTQVDHTETHELHTQQIDPRTAIAGAAVKARREELGYSPQDLDDDGAISHLDLRALEHGRSWPGDDVRARLEKVLSWPPGTLDRVHSGGSIPDEPDETTEFITHGVRVAILVDALELSLSGIRNRVATLPLATASSFSDEAAALLAEIRRLESTVLDTVATTKGAALLVVLGDVRRTYHDLVRRAAAVPDAPLSIRLSAARRQAELTPSETAGAAGVEAQVVIDAEADRPIPEDAAAALETVITQLNTR